MIRPVTFFCAVIAAGAGLFLYMKKHETLMLDQHIMQIVKETHGVQAQTVMLRTRWALLNQPDRLGTLSARVLPRLRGVDPTQFVRLSQLERRLPPVSHQAPTAPLMKPDAGRVASLGTIRVADNHTSATQPPVMRPAAAQAPILTASATPVAHHQAEQVAHKTPEHTVSTLPTPSLEKTLALMAMQEKHTHGHRQPVMSGRRTTLQVASYRPHSLVHTAAQGMTSLHDDGTLPPPVPFTN